MAQADREKVLIVKASRLVWEENGHDGGEGEDSEHFYLYSKII